jgi:endoglucanase
MKTWSASLSLLSCITLLVLGCASGQQGAPPRAVAPPGSPVALHGRLRACGNRICGQHGKPVQLRGMNFFWSNTGWGGERFFQAQAVDTLVDQWHATLVRAALGIQNDGGWQVDREGNEARVRAVVDAAIARGIYVIVDWHSHALLEKEAVEFFSRWAAEYKDAPNLIWETFNEPKRHDWIEELVPYHEAVIRAIRKAGSRNLVVLGTPAWSQDVDSAALDPVTSDKNVAYALHFYAATHKQSLRDKGDFALKRGVPIVVTEWGSCNADADGTVDVAETKRWLEWMDQNQVSSANWSLNDKREAASALVPGAPAGGWTDAHLTPSGVLAKEYISAGAR